VIRTEKEGSEWTMKRSKGKRTRSRIKKKKEE